MIRERRPQDLDRLCDLLAEVDARTGVLRGRPALQWLLEAAAETSWVFDQAPVTVAPTRNVVGHVQMSRAPDERWVVDVVERTGRRAEDLLVVGRLFVKPGKHEYGILRYLLTESLTHVERQGSVPVLDPAARALVPRSLCAGVGLRPVGDGDDTVLTRDVAGRQ